MLACLALSLLAATGFASTASTGTGPYKKPRSVLMIVADDLGVDMLPCYGEGNDLPVTPNLDALAAQGVLFRNTWSNPVCSPSRATIQTGRYSSRYDMLWIVTAQSRFGLPADEICIPRALDLFAPFPYQHAAIGKWHLHGISPSLDLTPNAAGYQHFQGTMFGFHKNPPNGYYYLDNQITNGTPSTVTTYNTTLIANDAIAWWNSHSGRRFAYVAFNAPHHPYEKPPQSMCSVNLSSCPPGDRPVYKAMIEAMDLEIGRLVAAVRANDPDAVIIFCGDNGTPTWIPVAPFDPLRAKGTVFEGGVNVPLIVSGSVVKNPGRESAALVNLTDLFATVLDLAAADLHAVKTFYGPRPLDSQSIVPYLVNPNALAQRRAVYTEMKAVTAQGPGPLDRAARDSRYKLRRIGITPQRDEFYDLATDPFEKVNLILNGLGQLTGDQLQVYQDLSLYIEDPVIP